MALLEILVKSKIRDAAENKLSDCEVFRPLSKMIN